METKKKLWLFTKVDYKAAELYLQQQAEKGLQLRGMSGYGTFVEYNVTEPARLKYCIDSFKGSDEQKSEYLQLASDAGWKLLFERDGLLYFVSKPPVLPPSMHTDWREEYRQLRKSFWKSEIKLGLAVSIILGLLFWFLCFLYQNGEYDFQKGLFGDFDVAFNTVEMILIAVTTISAMLRGIVFFIRSQNALKTDTPFKPATIRQAQFWGRIHNLFKLGMVMFMIGNGLNLMFEGLGDGLGGDTFKLITYGVLAVTVVIFLAIASRDKHLGEPSATTRKATQVLLVVLLIFVLCTQCRAIL